MADIPQNLSDIRQRIENAAIAAGRSPAAVELVAVSKTFPPEAISAAHDAGQKIFGESRIQEALPKIDALPGDIIWHFIGRVQRNKLRKILASCKVVHGIESTSLATAADRIVGEEGWHPQIFLQVNIANEESKGGFSPAELIAEMPALLALPNLEILGLMSIPPPAESTAQAREPFAALRKLRDQLEQNHSIRLPGLSMGMSDDFEAAITEGATHVRVGSAIFGRR